MIERSDRLKSLYVDMPNWSPGIAVDDFVVAIGKTKSNSVYHVASVRPVQRTDMRVIRYYMKVYMADLLTVIRRGPGQRVITLQWYSRNKKK